MQRPRKFALKLYHKRPDKINISQKKTRLNFHEFTFIFQLLFLQGLGNLPKDFLVDMSAYYSI